MLNSLAGGEGPTVVAVHLRPACWAAARQPGHARAGHVRADDAHFIKVGAAAARGAGAFLGRPARPGHGAPGALLTETIAGAGFTGSDNPLEGLENIAGVTGGQRLSIPAAGDTTLIRVARETAGYYLAVRRARRRRERRARVTGLDVRVTRSGVVVRSRPEFTTTRAKPVAAGSDVDDAVRDDAKRPGASRPAAARGRLPVAAHRRRQTEDRVRRRGRSIRRSS